MIKDAVVLIGGGGHAKVLADCLRLLHIPICGIIAPSLLDIDATLRNYPYLGNDDAMNGGYMRDCKVVNGIGMVGASLARKKIYELYKNRGYVFQTIIHPSAVVSNSAKIFEGVQIMAGTVIQPDVTIGANTIINTRTSIDHDCAIGAHTHVAPGVTLSGGCCLGEGSFIGTGSTIIESICIGDRCLIGAGSVVIRNVTSGKKAFGVPAKEVD